MGVKDLRFKEMINNGKYTLELVIITCPLK